MTTEVIVALIAVPAAILPSVVAFLSLRQSQRNEAKIISLDVRVDGRLTQLLETTRSGAFAKGQAKEAADEHVRKNGNTGDTGGVTAPEVTKRI